MARIRIGQLLVTGGQLDAMQLDSALAHQRQWGGRLGQAIVRLGFLTEERLLEAVGSQLGAPFVVIGQRLVPPTVLALVPRKLIRARRALPLEKLSEHRRGPLVVATSDPLDVSGLDAAAFASGKQVRPVLAARGQIEVAIARHQGRSRPEALELPPEPAGEMDLVQPVARDPRFWN